MLWIIISTITYLKDNSSQLVKAFASPKLISYLAANAPIECPRRTESTTCMKHGRPIGFSCNNPWKGKEQMIIIMWQYALEEPKT